MSQRYCEWVSDKVDEWNLSDKSPTKLLEQFMILALDSVPWTEHPPSPLRMHAQVPHQYGPSMPLGHDCGLAINQPRSLPSRITRVSPTVLRVHGQAEPRRGQ